MRLPTTTGEPAPLRAKRTPAGDAGRVREKKDDTGDADERRGPRIRCPKCGWEPERDSLWMCTCQHIWNTFDTGGRCPACGYQWEKTCCLRCLKWSPHRDWYEAG